MPEPLRILCVADLHNQPRCLEYLGAALTREKPDLVLVAGDITEKVGGNISYLKSFLNLVKKKHRTELFGVHGNNDSTDIFDLLEATEVSLHMRIREYRGHRFSGIGGWGDLSERVLDEEAERHFNPAGTVFVTHVPPRRPSGGELIAGNLPLIHICGHTHSTERSEEVGGVPVLRLKTAMLDRGAILELPLLKSHFVTLSEEQ